MEGRIEATVEQVCRITKEIIQQHVTANFTCYSHEEDDMAADLHFGDNEDRKLIDIVPVRGGKLDLGEVAAQYLGVNIDRFPISEKVPEVDVPFDFEDNEEGFEDVF